LASIVLAAGCMDGQRAGGRARGRPTLHGGPVRLPPVMAIPCFLLF